MIDYYGSSSKQLSNVSPQSFPMIHSYVKTANTNDFLYSTNRNKLLSIPDVRNAIRRIVREISKAKMEHYYTYNGYDVLCRNDTSPDGVEIKGRPDFMNVMLKQPNEYMTQSQFLEKVAWDYIAKDNSFIVIKRDDSGRPCGLIPVSPDSVSFLYSESGVGNGIYVKLDMAQSNVSYLLPFSDVIHLKTNYHDKDLIGGSDYRHAEDYDTYKKVILKDELFESLNTSMKANGKIHAILSTNGSLSKDSILGNRDVVIQQIGDDKNPYGIIALNSSQESIVPFNVTSQFPDYPKVMQEVFKMMNQRWGISQAILDGDYTPQQYNAFYSTCIEPIFNDMEQEFTNKLFTLEERMNGGHKIKIRSLLNIPIEQKVRLFELMSNTGTITNGYALEMFGMPADMAGRDKMDDVSQSLNFSNKNIVDDYQMGKAGLKTKGGVENG